MKRMQKISLICILTLLCSTFSPFTNELHHVYAAKKVQNTNQKKSLNKWDKWNPKIVEGKPSFQLEKLSTPITNEPLLKITLSSEKDQASLQQNFSITGGNLYVVDTYVKASEKKDSVFKTIVTPYSKGKPIKKDGKPITYLHHNNTRRDVFDENFTRVRVYFKAPIEADSILVEHYATDGPITLWMVESKLQERPKWQDIIGKYKSSDIQHPIQGDISKMFWSGQWNPIKNEKEETLLEKIQPLLTMEEKELIQTALKNAKTRTYLDHHPEYEAMARRLAIQYNKTKRKLGIYLWRRTY